MAKKPKPQEQNSQQMADRKTLMEMVLDDAERDRPTEQWKGTFQKAAICDVIKLGQVKERLRRTDEGRLSEGLQREEEIYLYATFAYIQNWCGKLDSGISPNISVLYEELGKHGKEVYALARIKEAARKILAFTQTQRGVKKEDGIYT